MAFERAYDYAPHWDEVDKELRKRSNRRMDLAHDAASETIGQVTRLFLGATQELRTAYILFMSEAPERDKRRFMDKILQETQQFSRDTGIVLPFDEIHRMFTFGQARNRLAGVILAKNSICEQEFLTALYALLYYLHDNGYYQQIYDMQKASGLAFPPPLGDGSKSSDVDRLDESVDEVGPFVERVTDEFFSLVEDAVDAGLSTNAELGVIEWRMGDAENYLEYAVSRLVHTETTRAIVEAENKAARRVGFKRYRFLTEKDDKVCDACSPLNEKVFRYATRVAGVNYPPMHPNCRCQTMPFLDANAKEALLQMSSTEGAFFRIVPRDMGYARWLREWDIAIDEIMGE